MADDRRAQTKGYAHLTLLAETNEGYANLIKLSSLGYLEGYYYKPRVDWELLETHAKGLVALGVSLRAGFARARRGAPARRAFRPRSPRADLRARLDVRGATECGLEERADQPQAGRTGRGGGPSARRHRGRPLPRRRGRVRARGAPLHPVGRHAQEPGALAINEFFFKTPEEMAADFGGTTRSRARSRSRNGAPWRSTSARSCSRSTQCPRSRRLRLPRRAVREGPGQTVRQRDARAPRAPALRVEDGREMGFADYFLIVWDFIHFAKQNGISVGPGRGSSGDRSRPTAWRSRTSIRSATASSSSGS